jgi:hypothetical protein
VIELYENTGARRQLTITGISLTGAGFGAYEETDKTSNPSGGYGKTLPQAGQG